MTETAEAPPKDTPMMDRAMGLNETPGSIKQEKTEEDKRRDINSLEEGFEAHDQGAPAENIEEAPAEPVPPDDKPEKTESPFAKWFNSKQFIDDMIVDGMAWVLTKGNIMGFNAIYKNKYEQLPDDAIELDKEDRKIIDAGLKATIPQFYAWIKKQRPEFISLIYLEVGMVKDMKAAAVPLGEGKKKEDEKPAHKKTAPKEKPVEKKKPVPVSLKIIIPDFGKNVASVRIDKWLKKPGDVIKIDDILLRVGNDDDVDKTIYSDYTGILQRIIFKENNFVTPGTSVGLILSQPANKAKG